MGIPVKIKRIMEQEPIVETHGKFKVVREDLIPGGAKMRFLPLLVQGQKEIVFGGPFCGGAPYALSELGKVTGQKITLFYAKRANLHERQIKAKANGAKLHFVSPGYMTVVQARARAYAAKKKALFLELGFDMPETEAHFVRFLTERLVPKLGKPPEIWCAMGSGLLARCLGKAFPKTTIHAVAVGLASKHGLVQFPSNVQFHVAPYDFQQECKAEVPFPSCPNYDRKAWEAMNETGKKGAVLFNVL